MFRFAILALVLLIGTPAYGQMTTPPNRDCAKGPVFATFQQSGLYYKATTLPAFPDGGGIQYVNICSVSNVAMTYSLHSRSWDNYYLVEKVIVISVPGNQIWVEGPLQDVLDTINDGTKGGE